MSRKADFKAMTVLFKNQLQIADRTFQDFNGLITRANTNRLRLSDLEREELHQIYKSHKLGLLDRLMSGEGKGEYPVREMFEVINRDHDNLRVSGVLPLSKEEIERIFTAVLNAELKHKNPTPEKIRLATGTELDEIIAARRG